MGEWARACRRPGPGTRRSGSGARGRGRPAAAGGQRQPRGGPRRGRDARSCASSARRRRSGRLWSLWPLPQRARRRSLPLPRDMAGLSHGRGSHARALPRHSDTGRKGPELSGRQRAEQHLGGGGARSPCRAVFPVTNGWLVTAARLCHQDAGCPSKPCLNLGRDRNNGQLSALVKLKAEKSRALRVGPRAECPRTQSARGAQGRAQRPSAEAWARPETAERAERADRVPDTRDRSRHDPGAPATAVAGVGRVPETPQRVMQGAM